MVNKLCSWQQTSGTPKPYTRGWYYNNSLAIYIKCLSPLASMLGPKYDVEELRITFLQTLVKATLLHFIRV